MKKFVLILLMSVPLVSIAQQMDGQYKVKILFRMESLKRALIVRDSTKLNEILANDVTFANSNGLVQTKSQLLYSVMSGEKEYKTIRYPDMDVRIYNNSAVANAQAELSVNYQGNMVNSKIFITAVWIKKNEWQLVAWQEVKQ